MSTRFRVLLSLVVLLVASTACTTSDDGDESAPSIVTPTEVADDAEVAQPTPEGRILGEPFALELGDCFNEYVLAVEGADQETREITTVVDCRRPHDGEVYALHTHPADATVPFPGNVAMNEWAVRACYESFEAFVGALYELSALEIGVIHPNEENWTAGPYRQIHCYVHAPDGQLSGPMRGSGI